MSIRRFLKHPVFLGALSFVCWSLLFGVIYAQSPLYTNNQNAYFLHGLAKAGFGYLSHDWLATRQESMPVFSGLVYLTYILFHSKVPFYLYYALLMGVYLFSMFGIMDHFFDLRRSKIRTLIFLALFLLVHSAALRYLLSRLISIDSTFLLEGGAANQRLLGQVFQPSVFGVFLILSIYLFIKDRPFWSLVPIAVAIYFHPVYLLAGALLTISYMWAIFQDGRNWKRALLLGTASLLLVAPDLIYTILIFSAPSPEIARQALDILVNYRNPHHAIVADWLNWTVLVQGLILLGGMLIVRKTRLFQILVLVTAGTLLLTVVQVLTANAWLALIFPWRVSVILVPTGTTILIAALVTWVMNTWKDAVRLDRWWTAGGILVIVGLMAIGAVRFEIESSRQLADPARPMMDYVAAHKSSNDLFLVPAYMTDFRLVTGAPIYVDFKDAPDRDTDVLEWYRRLQDVSWFYNGSFDPCQTLKDMAAKYGITQAVVETQSPFTVCRTLPTPYQDDVYRIYKLTATP